MKVNPGSAREHALLLRRTKELEAHVKGLKSIRQIAEEFGISVATAHQDIRIMIEAETAELGDNIKTARQVENQRLDEWLARTMKSLEKTSDVDEEAKLLQVALKISERRARLLGLDSATKHEIDALIGSSEATPSAARALMKQFFSGDVKPIDEPDVSDD